MNNRFWIGFWRLADPKISLASFASIFLGACAAAAQAPLDFFWLTVTALGIFAIEIAKNASGEIFDFNSGNDLAVQPEDRSPFSGGKRVLLDELLTRNQTAGIAAFFYGAGSLAGITIVIWREQSIIWLGVLGLLLAFFYHSPPLKFSYRGLGELVVGISYGPLICTGTYLVQRGEIPVEIIVVSTLLGLLIASFLLINEFPDYRADQVVQKRTLVVRFGRKAASRIFSFTIIITLLVLIILPFLGFPLFILLGLFSLIPAYSAVIQLTSNPDTIPEIIPAQAQTLLTFLIFAAGTGTGFLLDRLF